jgi:Domain of unknown function (DUF1963)
MKFRPAEKPITDPVTKLGGQPTWLGDPQWPLSAELGTPMRFLGQFLLSGEQTRLAYLFLTDDEEGSLETFVPDSGENALIIQPDGRIPGFLRVDDRREGPSLLALDEGGHGTCEVELTVELVPPDVGDSSDLGSWIGGKPHFIQYDEYPEGEGWRFLFQLDSANQAFSVNFGDSGVGYGFVSADCREGRFLWQSF